MSIKFGNRMDKKNQNMLRHKNRSLLNINNSNLLTILLKINYPIIFVILLFCSNNNRHENLKFHSGALSQQARKSPNDTVQYKKNNSPQSLSLDSIQIGPDLNDFIPLTGSFKKLNGPTGIGEIVFDITGAKLFAKSHGTVYQFNDSTCNWLPFKAPLPENLFKEKDLHLSDYRFRRAEVTDSLSGSGFRNTIVRRHVNKTEWTRADSALMLDSSRASVHAIAVFKGNLYASLVVDDISESYYYDFVVSGDYGNSWSKVPVEFPNQGFVDSFFSTGDVLFLKITNTAQGTSETYSTFDGITWKRHEGDHLNNSELPSRLLSTMARIGKSCFIYGQDVGGGVHLFTSVDNGYDWKSSPTIQKPTFVNLYSMGNRLVAYNLLEGIFISSDNGTTWRPINNGLPTEKYKGNSVALCKGAILISTRYLAGYLVYKLFISGDNGTNWSEISLYNREDNHIDYLQQINNSLLLGGREGVFCSNDCGANWRHVLSVESETKAAKIDSQIFIGTTKGMYVSSDSCSTWRSIYKTKWDQGLFELVNVDTVLYKNYLTDSCSDVRIIVSKDKGKTWSPLKSCFPAHVNLYSMGSYLIASTDSALFAYSDSARKWSLVNAGFLRKGINCFVQYNNNYFIVIGTELFITDMDTIWERLELPPECSGHVLSMSFDSTTGVLCTGADLWQLKISK